MDPFTIAAVIGVNCFITHLLNKKLDQELRTQELEEELEALRTSTTTTDD
jgi:hypothetical protein